jgi:hypothetical protein
MTNVNLNNQGLGGQGTSLFGQNELGNQATPSGLDALLKQPTFTFDGANMRSLSSSPAPDPAPDYPDIIVEGRRLIETFDFSAYVDSFGRVPQNLQDLYVSELKTFIFKPITVPKVHTQVIDPKNQKAVEEAAKTLDQKLVELAEKIADLHDDTVVEFKDGTTMTGKEVKALWAKAEFTVTDRDFGHPKRGGAVVGNMSFINFDTVNRWNQEKGGLAFIIVHELYHMTEFGAAEWNARFQIWQEANPNGTEDQWFSSQAFLEAESYADNFAFTVTEAADVEKYEGQPVGGY